MKFRSTLTGLCAASVALATPAPITPAVDEELVTRAVLEGRFAEVDVQLPSGGTIVGRSLFGVESFNAIPYADPPVGPLRLKPPRKFSGKFDRLVASGITPSCPQMLISRKGLGAIGAIINDVLQMPLLKALNGQEDCLTVTVQRPSKTKANAKLPVFFWIYGGAFEFGSTKSYDAKSLLHTAVHQNQPFIFVAVNYRVAGFGFMPGKEILADGSANIGLLDQRMGLEWVADNIEAFGGDPSKVTIWGESAGAISVLDQMLLYDGNATYKGKPLFRGAIMNSGSVITTDPVDCPKGQAVYDTVVREAGCSASKDTLECLRATDYKTFLNAVNSVPGILSHQTLALSYLPRPDGKVLSQSPEKLMQAGKYHAVPMILGNQEDEGTIFAILTSNITSIDKTVDYLSKFFFHGATKAQLKELVELYEPAHVQGSPFRTGILNELYPGFKRMAALFGDLTFIMSRRLALNYATTVNPHVPSWSYLSSYDHGTPFVGTFHASDILQVFHGILPNYAMRSCRTYYLNFLHNQDPNKGVESYGIWPRWRDSKKLMWFKSPNSNDILADDFRSRVSDFIAASKNSLYF
ncbi:hypothetical protein E4U42_004566 [Claviceps africana]|uniref:Carboxylic ester hydrolase n=1 Tax=Claviceps africana TaxID=83212 RepID=A0A8K0J7T9_9HYPO|nr:hypothetical protein E4U42_004566 [Claviceps africana]